VLLRIGKKAGLRLSGSNHFDGRDGDEAAGRNAAVADCEGRMRRIEI